MSTTVIYELPFGTEIKMQLERNNSTTIIFDLPGDVRYEWNSGVFMACNILASGFSLMVTAYTANPYLGFLTQALVTQGCTKIAEYVDDRRTGVGRGGGTGGTDIGSMNGPNPTQQDPKKFGGYWEKTPVTSAPDPEFCLEPQAEAVELIGLPPGIGMPISLHAN